LCILSPQGKRGLEKPPFKLPDFIEATGISKMREAYVEKEAAKQMKQKQRERMAPKMGRMDIDYQVQQHMEWEGSNSVE
jgi:splicing factor 3B subunit 2